MAIYVGHRTALSYWRNDGFMDPFLTQARPREGTVPSDSEIARAWAKCVVEDSECLHLYFATRADRRKIEGCIAHVQGTSWPRRSYCQIDEGVYLASPEACILQIAEEESIPKLAYLISELCGWHATDHLARGMVPSIPRMTVGSLKSYLRNASGSRGVKKARRAADFAFDGAASPMETKLALLLSLPTAYGGYGIPKPVLNAAVSGGVLSAVPPRKGDFFLTGDLRCDLSWPEKGFALEYDSSMYHDGRVNIDSDSKRRTRLEANAVRVLSVTKGQVYDYARFDELARVVAEKIGYRPRIKRQDWSALRGSLRKELLSGETDEFGA